MLICVCKDFVIKLFYYKKRGRGEINLWNSHLFLSCYLATVVNSWHKTTLERWCCKHPTVLSKMIQCECRTAGGIVLGFGQSNWKSSNYNINICYIKFEGYCLPSVFFTLMVVAYDSVPCQEIKVLRSCLQAATAIEAFWERFDAWGWLFVGAIDRRDRIGLCSLLLVSVNITWGRDRALLYQCRLLLQLKLLLSLLATLVPPTAEKHQTLCSRSQWNSAITF